MALRISRLLAVPILAAFAPLATAQTASSSHLVNIDTGLVLPKGRWEATVDGLFFGGREESGYGALRGYYGFGNGFGATLKGAFGDRKDYFGPGFGIRYGGTDVEGQVLYAVPSVQGLSVAAGISFPSTPSQKDAFLTAAVSYRLPIEALALYVGARGQYRDRDSLTALTFGAAYDFSSEWSILGDLAVPLSDNSFSTANADRQRTVAFGAALRYAPAPPRTSPISSA